MTQKPASVGTVLGLAISMLVASLLAQFTKDWAFETFGLLPIVWITLATTVVGMILFWIWLRLQRNFGER